MRSKLMMLVVVVLLSVNVALADTFLSADGQSQFDIDFVTISGDTNPTSGYGIVNNDYRMGMYEITNDQFAKFASNNPYFTYGAVPANRVTWLEAAQFVNFLNTSTGNPAAYNFNGSTFGVWESGDAGYDASNPFRNSNAHYFMPTEDEWVKAAYWNGTSLTLQTFANALSSDLVSVSPDPEKWNYYPSAGSEPWDVGSGSEELNGTYDMMGNVWEWMESPYSSGDYLSGSDHGVRGGSYGINDYYLSSSSRNYYDPYFEHNFIGFRVASVIPEPCSLVVLSLGGLMLRRRRA